MRRNGPKSTQSRPVPAPESGAAALRIVVVAPELEQFDPAKPHEADAWWEAERSRALRLGLLKGGFNIVAVLPADAHLAERIAQLQPDLIIVDAESGARDALEHVVVATRDARRPIVLFTDDDDTRDVGAAIAAGVSAYIVAGLAPARVRPVLDVAIARFRHEEALRRELAEARLALDERKLIERAKGLLMQHHGIGEDEAFRRLRAAAMNKQLKLAEVAKRLVDAADLLG
jgi:response regulator NasT